MVPEQSIELEIELSRDEEEKIVKTIVLLKDIKCEGTINILKSADHAPLKLDLSLKNIKKINKNEFSAEGTGSLSF